MTKKCFVMLGLLGLAARPAAAQEPAPSEAAARYEAAARDFEEAAGIWEGLGERGEAARRWAAAADNWERAARAWEEAGEAERAARAWSAFRRALAARARLAVKLEPVDEELTVEVEVRPPPVVRVRVVDEKGKPVARAGVVFEWGAVPQGAHPRILNPEATSDSDGIATTAVDLGRRAGRYLLLARVPGQTSPPLTISIKTKPAAPHRLEAAGPTEQILRVNQTAAFPFEVRVTDLYGNPVPNVPVSFAFVSVPQGAIGQALEPRETRTDERGLAALRVRAGSQGGEYLLKAESGELEGSPLRLRIVARQTIPTVEVREVRIEGSEDEVFLTAASEIQPGGVYLTPELARLSAREVDRLYATGRFSDVAMYVDEVESGLIDVILRVRPRPVVGDLEISGAKKVDESRVRSVISLSRGGPFDPAALPRAEDAVRGLYKNEGFLGARVEIDTRPSEGGAVDVAVRIDEGKKTEIRRLEFVGNEAISDLSLNWNMKTGAGRVLKMDEFREDREKILGIYQKKGYLSARMGEPEVSFDEHGRMHVTIRIVEGPRYKLGEVRFSEQDIVPKESLERHVEQYKGKYFRADKFFRALDRVRQEFSSLGYAEARVVPRERLDEIEGVANWDVEIDPGQVLVLDTVVVVGNERTRSDIIAREIRVRPGEVIDGRELDRSREALENLQYFEPGSVRLELRRLSNDPADTKRMLVASVKEGRTGEFQFGAGFSSADGLVGFLSLNKRNFAPFRPWHFTGDGQEIQVAASFGSRRNSYSVSWTEPWWRGRPMSLGFDVFNVSQERTGYDWLRRGGAIRFGWRPSYDDRFHVSYNYRKVRAENIDATAPTEILNEAGFPENTIFDRTTTSILTRYTRDKRDSVRFPREGYRAEVGNELAATWLGGNVGFNKPWFDFSNYLPGGFRNVIAYRLYYATMFQVFDAGRTIPNTEKLFLGGIDSIRGYPDREIQVYDASGRAVGSGKTAMFANFEYRIPIDEDDRFSLALFFDVGGVFDGSADFDADGIVKGAGVGFRFFTPIGPLRIEWGHGFDFPNRGGNEVHFTIGHPF